MRGLRNRDVQLLAHISAPSGRSDDDRYKAQAAAYLNSFARQTSKVTRTAVVYPETQGPAQNSHFHGSQDEDSRTIGLADSRDSTTFIDDTQLAYAALESQLPSSSLAGPKSSAKRRISERRSDGHVENTKLVSSSRFLAQNPNVLSSHGSKRRRGNGSQPSSSDKDLVPRAPGDPNPPAGGEQGQDTERRSSLANARNQNETLNTHDSTSELPTSYSLSEVISGSLKERQQLSERSSSDPGPQLDALIAKSLLPTKLRGQQSSSAETASDEVRSNTARRRQPAATEPSKEATKASQGPSEATLAAVKSLSSSIFPPKAETSIAGFKSHISLAMEHLAQESVIRECYKPVTVSRHLSPLERGHWRIECSSWPLEEQISFWRSLEDAIGSGRAGWGVWCTRGPVVQCKDDGTIAAGSLPSSSTSEAATIGPIRVYCWGEVAKHVYLTLYVASKSRVRRLHVGLQWIDSEGLVVIQMSPRQA